jgi:hypothetical protein
MTNADLFYTMAVTCLISVMLLASKGSRRIVIGVALLAMVCGAAVVEHR